MNEVKRYTGKIEGWVLGSPHWEHPEGEWIKWEDYARLKADKDVLDKMLIGERLHCSLLADKWSKGEIAHLKAEVERLKEDNRQLTKAFEITEGIIKRMGAAVTAAKEGKSV